VYYFIEEDLKTVLIRIIIGAFLARGFVLSPNKNYIFISITPDLRLILSRKNILAGTNSAMTIFEFL